MSIEDLFYRYLKTYKTMPDWLKRAITFPATLVPRSFFLGSQYKEFYRAGEKLMNLSVSQIEEAQFYKLLQILHHAYNTVPYYKEQWDKLEIDINSIKDYDDFNRKIPFLTRTDIQQNADKLISSIYPNNLKLTVNTGGSTGNPLKLFYLKGYTRSAERAHWNLFWGLHGYKIGDRIARLRGDFVGKNIISSFDPYRNTLILSSFTLNRENAKEYIEQINKYRIKYLYGYPASIATLLQYLDDKPKHCLEGVILGSENIYERQIELIKELLNVNVIIKGYGLGENVAIAVNEPQKCNYMFYPYHGYTEFIRSNNTEFASNDLHEIVGTSFINPLMPLIRYKTNDFGILDSNIYSSNYPFKQLKEIVGREQEIAVGKNNERITLTALIFGRHGLYFDHIENMQIVNEKPGVLTVHVVPKSSFTLQHEQEIISMLSEKQGMPFSTAVVKVNKIEKTKSGKAKFLIKKF